MATRKVTHPSTARAPKRAAVPKAHKTRAKAAPVLKARTKKTPLKKGVAGAGTRGGESVAGLRVRMYRVGFGDFFLLSMPGADGEQHILIDCGVHAGDIHTIQAAVQDLAAETNNHLALVIMTHRHADHISGFATCKDDFKKFTVDMVWMSWFEDPGDSKAVAFQASLSALANRVQNQLKLAARRDPASKELEYMAQNATGDGGLGFGGASSNATALAVLHGGFANQAPIRYYAAGEAPELPKVLADAGLSARILGPPRDPALIAQMDNKAHQYLWAGRADVDGGADGGADTEPRAPRKPPPPFAPPFVSHAGPVSAGSGLTPDQIEKMVNDAQPDRLAAAARSMDKNLNNQSLVVLFTFKGKNLLFVGDAQWGNWENFLFGGTVAASGQATLTPTAKEILANVDFYKVGHHGSTNATPRDAVAGLRDGCVAMCSTAEDCYNGVPKAPLLAALNEKTHQQLARSDSIPANGNAADARAGSVPQIFRTPKKQLFIDYSF